LFPSSPRAVTKLSLSPKAFNTNPNFVLSKKSIANFTISKKITTTTIADTVPLNRCFYINSGIFDFPIILKFTLYNPVITIIPASRLVTFNFT